MLTPANIATLRSAAYRSQNRRTDEPRAVVTFEGGPLDGIRLSVLQREAVSPSLGFCTVTDSGPVVSMYSDAGRWRRVFEGVARVGCAVMVTPSARRGLTRDGRIRYTNPIWTGAGISFRR